MGKGVTRQWEIRHVIHIIDVVQVRVDARSSVSTELSNEAHEVINRLARDGYELFSTSLGIDRENRYHIMFSLRREIQG